MQYNNLRSISNIFSFSKMVENMLKFLICLFVFALIVVGPPMSAADENDNIIEHESGFYYVIQKGDTLWDLSQRFSDSPWQWPDLWKENSQISNPHWIYPGERIRLFRKKDADNLVQALEKQKLAEKKEPPKLPYYYYSPIDSTGFIRQEPVDPCGSIIKEKNGKDMISAGDMVFVMQNKNTRFIAGDKYYIYKTLKPLKDKKTKKLIGTQHYFTGILEITKSEPEFAMAKIIRSFRTIKPEDFLMPYKLKSPKIYLTSSKKKFTGNIIATEENQGLIGDDTVAFIDKGSNDGVKKGQFYRVFYNEKNKIKKEVFLTPINYGTIIILHTEENNSTILVTQADRAIKPGDKICSPAAGYIPISGVKTD